jgi:hypothetical protein
MTPLKQAPINNFVDRLSACLEILPLHSVSISFNEESKSPIFGIGGRDIDNGIAINIGHQWGFDIPLVPDEVVSISLLKPFQNQAMWTNCSLVTFPGM